VTSPPKRASVAERAAAYAARALPAFAVVIVAVTVLVVGRTRPVVGARLRGGPTEGATVLSWRLELVERLGEKERAVAGRGVAVEARDASGELGAWSGVLDGEGAAAVSIPLRRAAAGAVRVRVLAPGAALPVMDTDVSLGRAAWASTATHHGGWVEHRGEGGVVLRVAAERGVFAVPFADPLWVEVRRPGAPPSPLTVEVAAEGAEVTGHVVASESRPFSRLVVTPTAHIATVTVTARAEGIPESRLEVSLAVVPGALHVAERDGALVVESPVAHERAYVAVVSDTQRVAGATVELTPLSNGGARGVMPLPALPRGTPLWAVVSSEADLASGSRVGWPLGEANGQPQSTFDVKDVLLADSVGDSLRAEARRVHGVRLLATVFAVLALALTALLVVRSARHARAGLESHLGEAGADSETTSRVAGSGGGSTWLVVGAVLCLALAATLVAVFALWR
jgi:hypothetical protein